LYSSMMAIGAAAAAGVSVPLADDLGLGWRGSLGVCTGRHLRTGPAVYRPAFS
jgi:cyanate permease